MKTRYAVFSYVGGGRWIWNLREHVFRKWTVVIENILNGLSKEVSVMEMEKDFILKTDGGVITSSRMRVWWLTTFQGYEVRRVSAKPEKNPFGKVQFVNHWELDVSDDKMVKD